MRHYHQAHTILRKFGIISIRLIAWLSVLFTLIPLLTAEEWYIRVFDFPRLQISFLALGSLLLFYFFDFRHRKRGWLLMTALLGVVVYQSLAMYPYTSLASVQVAKAGKQGKKSQISLLVANVYMHNKDYAKLVEMVERHQPDLLLILESDSLWEQQLAVLEKEYPHTVKIPQSNTYGMHLYSKLPLTQTKITYWLDRDIPSLKTFVQLPAGTWIEFHGLHPKPPVPTETEDSRIRDAEIVIVANRVSKSDYPVIVAGDFNDVAWSNTTMLFQQVSGLLDPRIGRGFYSTFHAKYPVFRWPLDHVFVSSHFKLTEMQRLPNIGSDHFPIYTKLSFEPNQKYENNPPQVDEEVQEEATETINEGIKDAKTPDEDTTEQE